MKPWMGIVIVIAVLVAGMWLMAPGDGPAPAPQGAASPGAAGSKATDDKIAVISRGSSVDIAEHLKEGRFTVVEFTADW